MTITWLPKFLVLIGYQISLAMELRWRASALAPLLNFWKRNFDFRVGHNYYSYWPCDQIWGWLIVPLRHPSSYIRWKRTILTPRSELGQSSVKIQIKAVEYYRVLSCGSFIILHLCGADTAGGIQRIKSSLVTIQKAYKYICFSSLPAARGVFCVGNSQPNI